MYFKILTLCQLLLFCTTNVANVNTYPFYIIFGKHTVVKCQISVTSATHIVPITLGAECSDNHIFVATFADSLNLDLSLKWMLDLFLF